MAKATPPARRRRRYASFAEAAEYAGPHERTLRRYVIDGRLTGYRVGPKILRVDLDEVDRLFRPVATGRDAWARPTRAITTSGASSRILIAPDAGTTAYSAKEETPR